MLKNTWKILIIGFVVGSLLSCNAAQTLIKKRNLDVQTKMSSTIFLEPVANNKKSAYVNIRNTSDKELNINDAILTALKAKGYVIVQDPDKARFVLQANILQVGKSDLRSSEAALGSGFGGAIVGGLLASNSSEHTKTTTGLLVGAASFIADSFVDDTFYSMITDIQVRERPLSGEVITQEESLQRTQGSNEISQQISGANIKWKSYQSRVVSTANKANLEFKEAKTKLEEGLIRSISGIF